MSAQNLTNKTIKGIKWSYTSTLFNTFAQIGLTAIMARILNPEAFGVVAMAGVILRFGQYFSQMGITQALVQKREISSDDIRVGFTSSVTLGFLFFGLFWFIAPLAGAYYKTETVVPFVRIMALSFLINGIAATANSLLRRKMDFRAIALTEIISYLLGYGIVGIGMARNGFGAWSLVGSSLSQSFISAALFNLFARHNCIPTFNWESFRSLYSYGSRVSIISFLEFLSSNLDTLLIGRYMGGNSIGLYNRAFMISNLPIENAVSSLSRVLFPAFSRIHSDTKKLASNYILILQVIGSLIIPLCFGMAAASDTIVLIILGPKWLSAAPVVTILCLVAPFNYLSHFGGVLLESSAKLNIKIIIQACYLTIIFILFIFFGRFGLMGFVMCLAVAIIVRHIVYILTACIIFGIKRNDIKSIYFGPLLTGLIVAGSIYGASSLCVFFEIGLSIALFIDIICGAIILILSFRFGPQKTTAGIMKMRLSVSEDSKINRLASRLLFGRIEAENTAQ